MHSYFVILPFEGEWGSSYTGVGICKIMAFNYQILSFYELIYILEILNIQFNFQVKNILSLWYFSCSLYNLHFSILQLFACGENHKIVGG